MNPRSFLARALRALVLSGAALLALFPGPVAAQWSSSTALGSTISTNPQTPAQLTSVSDGAGGAIFLWRENEGTTTAPFALRAQRMDANGNRLWGNTGIRVEGPVDAGGAVFNSFEMIADGEGGAFLAYAVDRGRGLRPPGSNDAFDTRIQRINATGQLQYGAGGRLLRRDAHFDGAGTPARILLPDGAGGWYVATRDWGFDPAEVGVRVFRLTGAGDVMPGFPVQVTGELNVAQLLPDQPTGVAGVRGTWMVVPGSGVWAAQRVGPTGALGTRVPFQPGGAQETFVGACTDGQGGVIAMTAVNGRGSIHRVLANGTKAWTEEFRRVTVAAIFTPAARDTLDAAVQPDGAQGCFVVWPEVPGGNSTVRVQRLGPAGERLLGDNGIQLIAPGPGIYVAGNPIPDGEGGLIVPFSVSTSSQSRLQRINATGQLLWPASGVVIYSGTAVSPVRLVSDLASGTVFGATSGNSVDAKRTSLSGALGSNTPAARLVNISARAQVGVSSGELIPGFVISGGSRRLLVRGIGPGLTPFGVPGVLADPQIGLFAGTGQLGGNNDWSAPPNVAATMSALFAQVGAFALATGSRDAAVDVTLNPGVYTAATSGVGATTGVGLVEVYEVPGVAGSGRIVNLSIRGQVGTGANALIPGLVIGGSGARTLLVRAVGPTLATFGVTGVLANPQLRLFSGTTELV